MIWQNLDILWLLLAIPALIIGQWWYKRRQTKKREHFFDESLFKKLYRGFWQTGNRVKTVCLYVGLAFFIIAAAGPKIGTEVREVQREGIELLIALDLSASMNAEDVQPSRLAKAKYEISRLLNQLQGDRVGLIVFTGSAYLQVPLTLDYSAMRMFLDITETNQMPNTATDLKSAMQLTARTFADENKQANNEAAAEVLLIISDGENHGDDFSQPLQQLKEQGVTVYTLGIGTRAGGTIPVYNDNGALIGYKRNQEGQIVTTELIPEVLQNIAQSGGGEYYEIGTGSSGIDAFLNEINDLQQGKFAGKQYADYKNQYRWPAIIGLGFLLVSLLFPDYRRQTANNRREM